MRSPRFTSITYQRVISHGSVAGNLFYASPSDRRSKDRPLDLSCLMNDRPKSDAGAIRSLVTYILLRGGT